MSLALLALPPLFGLWLWHMNRVMTAVPPEALALSPHRWSVSEIHERATQISKHPVNMQRYLPPATGRRYLVVGGSGFIGGWIVLHLLLRGEDPKNIRIVDICPPTRKDMLGGKATEVGFVAADIRDLNSVRAAFTADWPKGAHTEKGVTVIHTAAVLRFYERHESFIGRSAMVNVEGTRNLLTTAKETGVEIFIFTSTSSIPVRRTNFWVLPWQKRPETLVQIIDDSSPTPRKHEEFFSNYAYTKLLGETLVREADDPKTGFRTGCLRPGSAVIGSGGDIVTEGYLKRGLCAHWLGPMIQSFAYVENVSYGHLLYEARLLEAQTAPAGAPIQKLGGDAFLIADTGKPISHGDLHLALNTLTDTNSLHAPTRKLPAVVMLLIAHVVEFYYMLQFRLSGLLPQLTGDVVSLQPSIFDSGMIHVKLNDSRARLPPSEGGLGYAAPWTTLDGVCQVVYNHLKNEAEDRAAAASVHR